MEQKVLTPSFFRGYWVEKLTNQRWFCWNYCRLSNDFWRKNDVSSYMEFILSN